MRSSKRVEVGREGIGLADRRDNSVRKRWQVGNEGDLHANLITTS